MYTCLCKREGSIAPAFAVLQDCLPSFLGGLAIHVNDATFIVDYYLLIFYFCSCVFVGSVRFFFWLLLVKFISRFVTYSVTSHDSPSKTLFYCADCTTVELLSSAVFVIISVVFVVVVGLLGADIHSLRSWVNIALQFVGAIPVQSPAQWVVQSREGDQVGEVMVDLKFQFQREWSASDGLSRL